MRPGWKGRGACVQHRAVPVPVPQSLHIENPQADAPRGIGINDPMHRRHDGVGSMGASGRIEKGREDGWEERRRRKMMRFYSWFMDLLSIEPVVLFMCIVTTSPSFVTESIHLDRSYSGHKSAFWLVGKGESA